MYEENGDGGLVGEEEADKALGGGAQGGGEGGWSEGRLSQW